jgi:hypothetical protein
MALFDFPTATELRQVEQELLPRLVAARPVFGIFPIVDADTHVLMFEQRDNYVGLQQVRGLDGEPGRVKPIGGKRYTIEPGVYGEFSVVDEQQLTERRQWGTYGTPINITDLVREKQDQLLQRRLDRIEYIVWALLANGTFSVSAPGGVLHTDTFTLQTYASSVPWATSATATPLGDLRAVQLKRRGYSLDFGAAARLYMNQATFNALLQNTNAADLYGRRGAGLSTINGPDALNQLLAMDNLPTIVVYDQGYYDDSNAFQLFIPNNRVILVGKRLDNDPVGEYRMTRNANNPDLSPGPYTRVIDDMDRVPRTVEVHDGHNGGPVLYHPAAIVAMTV